MGAPFGCEGREISHNCPACSLVASSPKSGAKRTGSTSLRARSAALIARHPSECASVQPDPLPGPRAERGAARLLPPSSAS
jgi:hypothetical protein